MLNDCVLACGSDLTSRSELIAGSGQASKICSSRRSHRFCRVCELFVTTMSTLVVCYQSQSKQFLSFSYIYHIIVCHAFTVFILLWQTQLPLVQSVAFTTANWVSATHLPDCLSRSHGLWPFSWFLCSTRFLF